ncbi:MAG: pitrilysin family protein [Planctomycetota bacterium]
MSRPSLGILLASCFTAVAAGGATAQQVVERVVPNGMRIWDFPDDDADCFSIAVMVGVGGRDEPPEHAGIAHFLEHSLFLSTPTRPNVAADRQLIARGIGYNGYTSSEVTTYHLSGPAVHWSFMVEWLADHVLHARLDPAEVELERRTVLEEITTTGPDFRAITFENILYGNHPIARSVGGSTSTVGSVTVDDLRAFHGRHYRAGNMAVGFSGRVATEPCMQAIEAAFAELQQGEPIADDPPSQSIGDLLYQRAAASDSGQLRLGYHLRCTQPEELAALLVIEAHLARRFFDVAREERHIAYAPHVELTWARDAQRLEFQSATSERGNVVALAQIADGLVAELRTLDDAGVGAAANQAVGNFMCSSVEDLTHALELATWIAWHGGDVAALSDGLPDTTPAEVRAATERWLRPGNRYSLSNVRVLDGNRELWALLVVLTIGLAVLFYLYGGRLTAGLRTRVRRKAPAKGAVLAMPKPRPAPPRPLQPLDVDAVERDIQRFFEEEDRSTDER